MLLKSATVPSRTATQHDMTHKLDNKGVAVEAISLTSCHTASHVAWHVPSLIPSQEHLPCAVVYDHVPSVPSRAIVYDPVPSCTFTCHRVPLKERARTNQTHAEVVNNMRCAYTTDTSPGTTPHHQCPHPHRLAPTLSTLSAVKRVPVGRVKGYHCRGAM